MNDAINHARRIWLIWILIAAAFVRLATLGAYPLADKTEARYAEVAREMVTTDQPLGLMDKTVEERLASDAVGRRHHPPHRPCSAVVFCRRGANAGISRIFFCRRALDALCSSGLGG